MHERRMLNALTMPTRKSIEDKLDELDRAAALTDRAAQIAALEAALGAAHYRIVAKAASIAAEALLYELVPALSAAYPRFVEQGPKRDPSCYAKRALMRALVELDCDDVELFLDGLACRQLEPVYGGTADTAADVRASSAMGLVASGYSRALVELSALLEDPEAPARLGAVRAIACGVPREAELLLRAKALHGDPEPAVVGECLVGLLAVEPDESPAFVARFLAPRDDEALQELAALALGESRLDAALDHLQAAWDDVLPSRERRRTLIRAAALHRSDAALDWLVSLVAEGNADQAGDVLEALATFKRNPGLTERLEAALTERGDRQLTERFTALWR